MKKLIWIVLLSAAATIIPIDMAQADLYLGPENYFNNCGGIASKLIINQPCNILLTPDGHSLTDAGIRAYGCAGSTTLAFIFGDTLAYKIGNTAHDMGMC